MKTFRVVCLLTMLVPGLLHADVAGMRSVLQQWETESREWEAAYEYASPEGRKDLLKSKPDEVKIARDLWRESGSIINSPEALPAVIWFLDHSAAVTGAFDPAAQKKIGNSLIEALQGASAMVKGAGRAAGALSNSTNPQCRYILEQIRAKNPSSVDQGLASMGLALMMRENQGMRRDDPRMNAVRLKYIREAIVKAFDMPFAGRKVSDFATELLYEINNLSVRRKAPPFVLPGEEQAPVDIPRKGKNTLLVFWTPDIPVSQNFVSMVQGLSGKYPDLEVVSVCPALKSREGLEVKTLFDTPKGEMFRLYRVNEVPWICLIDKEGIIRMRGVPDTLFGTIFEQAMQTIDSPPDAEKNTRGAASGGKPAPTQQKREPSGKAPGNNTVPAGKPLPAQPQDGGGDMIPPPLKPIPLD